MSEACGPTRVSGRWRRAPERRWSRRARANARRATGSFELSSLACGQAMAPVVVALSDLAYKVRQRCLGEDLRTQRRFWIEGKLPQDLDSAGAVAAAMQNHGSVDEQHSPRLRVRVMLQASRDGLQACFLVFA